MIRTITRNAAIGPTKYAIPASLHLTFEQVPQQQISAA